VSDFPPELFSPELASQEQALRDTLAQQAAKQ
jgi:hypothetical protein